MTSVPRGSRQRAPADGVTVLTVFLVLLFIIPSNLVFRPLGASGTPSNIIGILALIWCIAVALAPRLAVAAGPQPIRAAAFVLCLAILTSYVAAMLRPIPPAEVSGANRGILMLAGWMGILLLTADGVRSAARLDVLLSRLVTAGTVLAGLGIAQFLTGFDITAHVHIPGLSVNWDASSVIERAGFHRVAGTATHPIEFGVTLATILPIAVARAFAATDRVRRAWFKVALIAMALPMSLSRSAFVVTGCAFLVFVPVWTREQRRRAAVIVPFGAVALRLMIPGLLGTVMGLFVNISSDPSYTARTQRYGIAGHFIMDRPIFGRGFFTFLPKNYLIFDNQYLDASIETGLVGLAALIMLFVVAFATARGARRRATTLADQQMGQAMAGAVLGACLSFATYDALSFPMSAAVTFFVIGCTGAHWRLCGGERDLQESGLIPVEIARRPDGVRPVPSTGVKVA